MHAHTHRQLGQLLADRCLPRIPALHRRAFLLGCVQPDKNPATYLKGSLRAQWLRGHNYLNARRFMLKLISRLEHKAHWSLLDYYFLGKLMHYTADAFTYPHNQCFPGSLQAHRHYEQQLHLHFCRHIPEVMAGSESPVSSPEVFLWKLHRAYQLQPPALSRDVFYAWQASSGLLTALVPCEKG